MHRNVQALVGISFAIALAVGVRACGSSSSAVAGAARPC